MKRRDFLKKVAGGGAIGGAALAGLFDDMVNASDAKTADIRDLFESDDAEVLALTQRVFDKCILEKLQPLR
ncbi:MAG: twin-arginine translocation signal domain-containing protein [Planctomycetota bacterium]|nr:twin-arginine translocation signal domain-containing protein [Planctomycetota bacterium]